MARLINNWEHLDAETEYTLTLFDNDDEFCAGTELGEFSSFMTDVDGNALVRTGLFGIDI